jgi:RimJ/RimL family protein N-acetyltransferase
MKSERLLFSHYTETDFDNYLSLVSNADVMKMVTGRPDIESEARKRLERMLLINQENPKIGLYKVSLRSNGNFVGHAKLEGTKKNEAEIGYLLMPEFWGKGYGSEIAEKLVDQGKLINEIHNLIAIIDPENIASKRILEKQGFQWDYDGMYIGLPASYYKMKL